MNGSPVCVYCAKPAGSSETLHTPKCNCRGGLYHQQCFTNAVRALGEHGSGIVVRCRSCGAESHYDVEPLDERQFMQMVNGALSAAMAFLCEWTRVLWFPLLSVTLAVPFIVVNVLCCVSHDGTLLLTLLLMLLHGAQLIPTPRHIDDLPRLLLPMSTGFMRVDANLFVEFMLTVVWLLVNAIACVIWITARVFAGHGAGFLLLFLALANEAHWLWRAWKVAFRFWQLMTSKVTPASNSPV